MINLLITPIIKCSFYTIFVKRRMVESRTFYIITVRAIESIYQNKEETQSGVKLQRIILE